MTGVEPVDEGRGADAPRPSPRPVLGNYGSPLGILVKLVALALLNAIVLWGLTVMADAGEWAFLVFSALALLVIDWVYLSRRRIPGKYLVPGTLFLLVFAVYPVLYTVFISTTNYGTGNNLSQEQAIQQIERQSISATDEATRYSLQILARGNPGGDLAFLLTDPDGERFLGTADELVPLADADVVADGRRETIDGFVPLNAGQAQDRVAEIRSFVVPGPEGEIDNDGFGAAFTKLQRYVYDAATGTMVDTVNDVVLVADGGYFVDDDGRRLLPGWRTNVGLSNYEALLTDPALRGNFIRVFVWTVVFAAASVFFSFSLGLLLALVFNNPTMRGRQLYRSLIIIPYALPSFMTALVWRGMFNQSFGVINRWLDVSLPWLSGQWLPYVSILIVNTWLGYVYMFLVSSGALQSIPDELTEAAKVDGATGPMRFRRITLPLLLVSISPLLIASFAFNFNNFNLIYLLTEGRPSIPGSDAGRTDILITYTYKVAFEQGARADYGFASALAVVIFLIVAAISAVSFRYTKQLEEIR
ncbi:MAG: ABC transporter permease subunit [Ilumatobacter sp.]|nr:MAG: ABC transporter permease subunit [Ilumatobacter sp.]